MPLVAAWLDNHLDDAAPAALEAALGTLGTLARGEGAAARLCEGGAMELAKAVVTRCCIDAETPAPGVLAATVGMLSRITHDASGVTAVAASGTLRRVVRAATAAPAYAADEVCMARVLELLTTTATAAPAAAEELASVGAQGLIVAGMNAHGTNASVLRGGAAALAALGAGEDAARICLEEVRALTHGIEAATEVTPAAVDELGAAVQRLGNFMMIPGVVTDATTPALMASLSTAVGIIAESELGAPEMMAGAVASLGRLVEVGGAAAEGGVPDAVAMVMDVVHLNPTSTAVREAAVHALGALGASSTGMHALHAMGAMTVITDAAARGGGGGGDAAAAAAAAAAAGGGSADAADAAAEARLGAVAAAVAARLADAAVAHAADLVVAAGGTEALAGAIVAAAARETSGSSGSEGGGDHRLDDMLAAVVAAGGEAALYDVVAAPATSLAVMSKALHALRAAPPTAAAVGWDEYGEVVAVTPPGRLRGLAHCLSAAVAAHAVAESMADARGSLSALAVAGDALEVLAAGPVLGAPEVEALVASGGGAGVVSLLTVARNDAALAGKALTVLASVAQQATPGAVVALLGGGDSLATIISLLRANPTDAAIATGAVNVLAAHAAAMAASAAAAVDEGDEAGAKAAADGGSAAVLSEEVMRAVSVAASALADDAGMRAAVERLTAAAPVRIDDVAASVQRMAASLDAAAAAYDAYAAVDIMTSAEGDSYYYDPATDETTWDEPASLSAYKAAVAGAAEAAVTAAGRGNPAASAYRAHGRRPRHCHRRRHRAGGAGGQRRQRGARGGGGRRGQRAAWRRVGGWQRAAAGSHAHRAGGGVPARG